MHQHKINKKNTLRDKQENCPDYETVDEVMTENKVLSIDLMPSQEISSPMQRPLSVAIQ